MSGLIHRERDAGLLVRRLRKPDAVTELHAPE